MIPLQHIPGLILHAAIGLFIGIITFLANSLARRSLRPKSDQMAPSAFPKKMCYLLLPFAIIAIMISYVQLREVTISPYLPPPLCFTELRFYERAMVGIRRMKDNYPENLSMFLSELEKTGMERDLVQALFICPGSSEKEISFEYFNPADLRPDAQIFIMLYEKSANHPGGSDRTVIYSTGEVDTLSEDDLHKLLSEQSISPDSFHWEPSSPEPAFSKSWWVREQKERASRKAMFLSFVLLSVLSYSFSVALRLSKRQIK